MSGMNVRVSLNLLVLFLLIPAYTLSMIELVELVLDERYKGGY